MSRLRVGVDGRVMQDRYHGIGRHTFEVVRRLAERDVDLVVFWDPTEMGRFDLDSLGAYPSVQLVNFPVPVASPLAQVRWPRLLASAAVDVLLVPYHLAAPWLHSGVPTVVYLHDCIFESSPAFVPRGRNFRMMYRAATRLSLSRATATATVSHATRRDISRHYGIALDDDAVIPHGVGGQFLELGEARRHRTAPAGGRPYVLHVGVQRPHKNHAVLIRALADVANAVPEVRLVLVGDADPRFANGLAELIRRYGVDGRVKVRSHVTDAELLRLYQGASVFAFPSFVEGFGLPVLEAMAAGVPTVTSDAAAVIEAAAGASLTVPAADTEAWAAALVRVLTEPALAAKLTRRGREIATRHTWEIATDRTLHLLERLGGRRAGRAS